MMKQVIEMSFLKILWGRKQENELTKVTLWFVEQEKKLAEGGEIEPPWQTFPDKPPWWGGWGQGYGEAWLIKVWSPYWERLDADEATAYLEKWKLPKEWGEIKEWLNPKQHTPAK